MSQCMCCIVSGRVQGVFFRATAVKQAKNLDLTGYAKNLPDGRVEVVACGDSYNLAKLRAWLAHGSPMAKVDDVECESIEMKVPDQFTIA
ncbi:MAG: acylphosphatase [Gammaproteobacteria bacterium]|nr:acylphosphatase [Gammaproteobacteria bacterium]PCH64824.1 MAG: acylphosphatase [Gammaproteobacteria bacterium]